MTTLVKIITEEYIDTQVKFKKLIYERVKAKKKKKKKKKKNLVGKTKQSHFDKSSALRAN